jgi:hypothetical protein
MATLTTNLSLTKPAFNEYFDSWDDVVNTNMDLIDAAVGALNTLTAGAAGGFGTIALRFADIESDVASVLAINDIDQGYAEGVPATGVITYLGPNDAAAGQGDAGRIFHSIGLQLAEASGLRETLDLDAGLASRLRRSPQGILSDGGAIDLFTAAGMPGLTLTVGPVADYEVLVNGVHGIIRGTGTGGGRTRAMNAAAAPVADALFYLLATAVGWDDLGALGVLGSTSGSTFSGAGITATIARPGDILEITAGGAAVHGIYTIKSLDAGSLVINGTFPANLSNVLSYKIRLRRWVTLSVVKQDTGAGQIATIVNGEAFDNAGALLGTVLAHAVMTNPGAVFDITGALANQDVRHAEGLTFDSGWQAAIGFFDGANLDAVDGGNVVRTYTVPLPDIPATWQLLWSASTDGSNAIPVPLEGIAVSLGFGVRQYWNRNVLSVLGALSAEILKRETGAAVALAGINDANARFRLIAKG